MAGICGMQPIPTGKISYFSMNIFTVKRGADAEPAIRPAGQVSSPECFARTRGFRMNDRRVSTFTGHIYCQRYIAAQ